MLPLAWREHFAMRAKARAAANLARRLVATETQSSEAVIRDGASLVSFASNDYLNLGSDPRVIEGAVNAAKKAGVGSGASRLISGTTPLHEELEEALASWFGSEACLLFTSGYQANVGVLSTVCDDDTLVASDILNHASIIDGLRLSGAHKRIYSHASVLAAEAALAGQAGRKVLVSDSLFSINGDRADVDGLARVANKADALLVLDDAHGLGVFGEAGRGNACDQKSDIVVGTLSKAFASLGGVVFASHEVREELLNSARSFIFSTAADMPSLGAALAALAIIKSDEGDARRARLLERASQLRDGLLDLGLETSGESQIVPLWLVNPEEATGLSAKLADAGYFVPAVRPPTVPEGRSMLRFSLHADLSEATIDGVLASLKPLVSR